MAIRRNQPPLFADTAQRWPRHNEMRLIRKRGLVRRSHSQPENWKHRYSKHRLHDALIESTSSIKSPAINPASCPNFKSAPQPPMMPAQSRQSSTAISRLPITRSSKSIGQNTPWRLQLTFKIQGNFSWLRNWPAKSKRGQASRSTATDMATAPLA